MTVELGPILGFRGRSEDQWRVCALLVVRGETPPHFEWSAADGLGGGGEPRSLKVFRDRTVWCVDWQVPMPDGEGSRTVSYRFGDVEADFTVPGKAIKELRIAYASCNGFSHPKYMKYIKDPNALWGRLAVNGSEKKPVEAVRGMLEEHERQPFHLLLMGGDQVYADGMWEKVSPLEEWLKLPTRVRYRRKFTEDMRSRVERFYFDLYLNRWSQPEPAAMMARIPTVMMWDDHDIFDGWGSYPPEQHECDVYQGIFKLAREHFQIFQLRTRPEERTDAMLEKGDGFTSVYDLGEVALAVLDLRSERNAAQIMSRETWDALLSKQDDDFQGSRHLLVMSSIPVVYLDLGIMERTLALVPGRQELEDDLLDHWRARPHRIERLRLIHRLLRISTDPERRCRVTLLSGDVHVAGMGAVISEREPTAPEGGTVINQLISSAIVHAPPPALVVYAFEKMAREVEEVDRGIHARLLPYPGTDRYLLGTRNWLSMTFDEQDRIWANWHAEGEERVFSKVVHPL